MTISDHDYNQARTILVNAGSATASKSHVKHNTNGGSPDSDGKQLLQEARDEFRNLDVGQPNLISAMTQAHYNAIHNAANQMNITDW
ncbi:hypothetical protein ACX1N5_15315 [Acinetobacter sp. ANC 4636]